MLDKVKTFAQSEKMMAAVNVLFFLAACIKGMIFLAYGLWLVYLAYCVRRSASKAEKTVYMILGAFVLVMIGINLGALLSA